MAGLQETEKMVHSMNAQFVTYLEKHRIYELFYVNNLCSTNIFTMIW